MNVWFGKQLLNTKNVVRERRWVTSAYQPACRLACVTISRGKAEDRMSGGVLGVGGVRWVPEKLTSCWVGVEIRELAHKRHRSK